MCRRLSGKAPGSGHGFPAASFRTGAFFVQVGTAVYEANAGIAAADLFGEEEEYASKDPL